MTKAFVEYMSAFNISTHTSLAGRDANAADSVVAIRISTHTSLAGRDQQAILKSDSDFISTHTSLAGRDCTRACVCVQHADFYSHVPRGT